MIVEEVYADGRLFGAEELPTADLIALGQFSRQKASVCC
jgi:hypothetical protein